MIVEIQQAPTISLSKNQIVYQFQGATDVFGVPFGPEGAYAELIASTDGYASGSTITVSWVEPDGTTGSVEFTASPSPTTITQYQSNDAGLVDITYFQEIADIIQAHPFVSPFLVLTAEDDDPVMTIVATAIDQAAGWIITFSSTGIAGASYTSNAAVSDNTPNNYEMILDVFCENADNTFTKIATVTDKPDAEAYMIFDIAEILNKAIRSGFAYPPIPAWDNVDTYLAPVIRRHYVRYREDYDDIVSSDWTNMAIKKTLYGGLKKNLFADYDLFSSLDANNSLISWYPDKKEVSLDQPEYIAWYNFYPGATKVAMEVTMVEEDGTTTVINKHTGLADVEPQDILLLPCGYDQLNLAAQGLDIKKYIVRIKDKITTDYHSQPRAYYVDTAYYEEKRYLMYVNSFGLPLTLRCLGSFDEALNVDRQESEKILPVDYQSLESQVIQYAEEYQNQFTYRSGYLTEWEVKALQEMLIINDVYQVTENGYTPIHIIDDKFQISRSRESLFSIEFRAVPRFKDKAYSNITMPLSPSQSGWGTAPGEFWWEENSEVWQTP